MHFAVHPMKYLKALILLIVGFLAHGCFQVHPDGPLEELVEDGIRDVTGLDIDLTSEDGQ